MLWFLNNKAITYLIQVLNNPLAFRVPKEVKEACKRKALDCNPLRLIVTLCSEGASVVMQALCA